MVFSSTIFVYFFLPITLILYFLLNDKYKKPILLFMSLGFYVFTGKLNFIYIIILAILNYGFGFIIHKYRSKISLLFAISVDVFVLFYFKYINYLLDKINQYLHTDIPLFELIIPLGISFVVFSMISYLVDIYRDNSIFTKNILDVGLYFFLFTKILQGPIILYKDFIKQVNHISVNFDSFLNGVERFIVGLFKKVFIADTLIDLTTNLLSDWTQSGIDIPTHWLVLVSYMFAIYFDWSGYSDMAIGISRMLGFDFKENFNFPYISTSISEFWRRWHISLGNWFKEYVYFPLGGSRRGNVYVNLIVVFILTGIWHGAGILYLLWGLIHGLVRVLEKLLMKKELFEKIPKGIRWIYVTLVVSFGWLIFLMPSKATLFPFLLEMFNLKDVGFVQFSFKYYFSNKIATILLIALLGSYVLPVVDLNRFNEKMKNNKLLVASKYLLLIFMFGISLMIVMSGSYSPFIYFQF
ncbi:MAG: MBOAT family O-acyltransferase [Lagierella massiliensis]|nr:MBOAT family O-acyltransferase [Lagierella massiliensis]